MIRIENLYEKISILREKHLINERYTRGKINAQGTQIKGEVGARVSNVNNFTDAYTSN